MQLKSNRALIATCLHARNVNQRKPKKMRHKFLNGAPLNDPWYSTGYDLLAFHNYEHERGRNDSVFYRVMLAS